MKVFDMFCGIGGFSEAARLAGLDVILAADLDPIPLTVHSRNHPKARHLQVDLSTFDFAALGVQYDVLLASPPCQGHSRARGTELPGHAALRDIAWSVERAIRAGLPRLALVENVPDFLRWEDFQRWKFSIEAAGYNSYTDIFDARSFGVPQARRRVFVAFERSDLAEPRPTFLRPSVAVSRPERPVTAREVIDFGAGRWSLLHDPKRSAAVLAQVERGIASGAHPDGRCIVPYYAAARNGRAMPTSSLDRPLPTVVASDRYAVVDMKRLGGPALRMLTVQETRAFMGFPEDYILPGRRRDCIRGLGNAVCPTVAAALLRALLDKL